MAAPAFFVMLKGPPKDLLKFQCGGWGPLALPHVREIGDLGQVLRVWEGAEVLPKVEVVWAAMGEFIVDAPWYFPPKGFKVRGPAVEGGRLHERERTVSPVATGVGLPHGPESGRPIRAQPSAGCHELAEFCAGGEL